MRFAVHKRRRLQLLLAAILGLGSTGPTFAATSTWAPATGGAWDFSSTTNWTQGVAYVDGNDVIFGNTGGGTITIGTNVAPATVTVNAASGTYVFSGAGVITGGGTLSKSGAGVLTLNSANSFTGGTTFSAGTLNLTNGAALGTGALNINATAAATLQFGTSTAVSFNNDINLAAPAAATTYTLLKTTGNNIDYNGAITGGGSNLTLFLNTGTGGDTTTIHRFGGAGVNTFVGSITLNRGAIAVAKLSAFGAATNRVTLNSNNNTTLGDLRFEIGGTFANPFQLSLTNNPISTNANDVTLSGVITGNGFTKLGGGKLTLTGTNTFTGVTTINAGILEVGNGGATGTLSATGNVVNNTTLAVNRTGTVAIGGIVSGTGQVTKTGSGTLTLSAANTYAGGTTINAGAITINVGTGLGPGTLNVASPTGGVFLTVANNAATTVANNIVLPAAATAQSYQVVKNTASATTGTFLDFTGVISGGGANTTFFLNSGTSGDGTTGYRLSGVNTFTAATINVNRGYLIVGNLAGLGAATNVVRLDSNANNTLGNLSFEVPGAFDNPITTTGLYPVNVNANDVTLNGIFSGAAFVKLGAGKLTSNAANTFTGVLNVNAGTLQLNGTNPTTANAGVAAGATLILGSTATLNSTAISVAGTGVLDVSAFVDGYTFGTGRTLTIGRTTAPANDYLGKLILAAGSTLNVGGTGVAATATVANDVAVTDATLRFDLNNTPLSGNDLIAIPGNLSLTGLNSVNINPTAGALANGTYTLITYAGTLTGDTTNLQVTGGGSGTTRQTYGTNTTSTPGAILLTVDGSPAPLIWTAANGPNWDLVTTVNWAGGTVVAPEPLPDDRFYNFDNTRFDDTAVSGNVSVVGNLTPTNVVIDNSIVPYVFSGVGTIAGVSLSKNGNGTVLIANTQGYSAGITVNAGSLQIGDGATGALTGSTGVTVTTGTTVKFLSGQLSSAIGNAFAGAGTVAFEGLGAIDQGGFTLTGNGVGLNGTITATNGRVQAASSTPFGSAALTTAAGGQFFLTAGTYANTFNVAGNGWAETAGQLGALRLSGGATISGPVNLTGDSRIGAESGTISGVVAGAFAVEKVRAGALTLSGANTFSGGITVTEGTLILSNNAAAGTGKISMPVLGTALTIGTVGLTIGNNVVLGDVAGNLILNTPINSTTTLNGIVSGGGPGTTWFFQGGGGGQNSGVLVLNGVNTFGGNLQVQQGPVVLGDASAAGTAKITLNSNNPAAGALQLAGNITIANNVSIIDSGESIGVGIGLSAGISGAISTTNSNGFAKVGAGTLTLTGTNTYAATTISAGTLRIGDGGTSGTLGTGAVVNNAALAFDRSDDLTVGTVISGTGSMTKAAAGTLTLTGTNTYTGGTTITAGTLQVGVGGPTGTVGTGAVTNNRSLIVNRTGVLTTGAISGTGTTTIQAGELASKSIRQSVLDVGAGARATLASSGGNKPAGISVFTSTTGNALTLASTGVLDVKDNDLIAYYPSGTGAAALATLRQRILDGFLGTAGVPRITSSTALLDGDKFLVALDNGPFGIPAWEGVTLTGSNQIIAKYTLFGDLNLDGAVDAADYGVIDNNFGTGVDWLTGDANLDGTVDAADYGAIDNNFGKSFPALGFGSIDAGGSFASGSAAFAAAGLTATAVPEPSSCVLGGLGLLGLLGAGLRRRRTRV